MFRLKSKSLFLSFHQQNSLTLFFALFVFLIFSILFWQKARSGTAHALLLLLLLPHVLPYPRGLVWSFLCSLGGWGLLPHDVDPVEVAVVALLGADD